MAIVKGKSMDNNVNLEDIISLLKDVDKEFYDYIVTLLQELKED